MDVHDFNIPPRKKRRSETIKMPNIIIQKSPEWPRNNTLKSFTHKSIFFTKRYLNLKNYGVNFIARTLYEKKNIFLCGLPPKIV